MDRVNVEAHAALTDAVDVDQIVHQARQAPCRKGNQVELAALGRRQFAHGTSRQGFGNADDAVERSAQFVAGVGNECVFQPVGFLKGSVFFLDQSDMAFEFDVLLPDQRKLGADGVAHALKAFGKPAQLGRPLDAGHGSFEVARGNRFGHFGQFLQRRRHGAREKVRDPEQDGQGKGRNHQHEAGQRFGIGKGAAGGHLGDQRPLGVAKIDRSPGGQGRAARQALAHQRGGRGGLVLVYRRHDCADRQVIIGGRGNQTAIAGDHVEIAGFFFL